MLPPQSNPSLDFYIMKLVDRIEHATITGDVRFQRNYSGRGMFGKECIGVVCSHADFAHLLATVVKNWNDRLLALADTDYNTPDGIQAKKQFDAELESLFHYQTDTMGKTDLIYYWPHLTS